MEEAVLRGRKAILWTVAVAFISVAAVVLGFPLFRRYQNRPVVLRGAIIKQDDDPIKQSPIMDVEISEADGLATTSTKSSFTGYFALPLVRGMGLNDSITLRFI